MFGEAAPQVQWELLELGVLEARIAKHAAERARRLRQLEHADEAVARKVQQVLRAPVHVREPVRAPSVHLAAPE